MISKSVGVEVCHIYKGYWFSRQDGFDQFHLREVHLVSEVIQAMHGTSGIESKCIAIGLAACVLEFRACAQVVRLRDRPLKGWLCK